MHFQPPYPDSFLSGVYESMGLDWGAFKSYQDWQGPSPEISLSRSPYGEGSISGKAAYGFFFGAKFGHRPGIWVKDPWGKNLEGTPPIYHWNVYRLRRLPISATTRLSSAASFAAKVTLKRT